MERISCFPWINMTFNCLWCFTKFPLMENAFCFLLIVDWQMSMFPPRHLCVVWHTLKAYGQFTKTGCTHFCAFLCMLKRVCISLSKHSCFNPTTVLLWDQLQMVNFCDLTSRWTGELLHRAHAFEHSMFSPHSMRCYCRSALLLQDFTVGCAVLDENLREVGELMESYLH